MPTITHPYPVLRQRLLEQGYQAHAPSPEAAELDAEACREWPCEGCGHAGLTYRPFWHPTERSYRAVAVCGQCGRVEEF